MSKRTKQLYNYVELHKDARLEPSIDNVAQFTERKREQTFQMLAVRKFGNSQQDATEQTKTLDSQPGLSMAFESLI